MENGSWSGVKKKWGLRRYYKITDWWSENGPPVYMAVAGYLGLMKKQNKNSDSLEDLLSMAGMDGALG